jgi:hypothetical protein
MSNVISFPVRMVDERTPPAVEVIVAPIPAADIWVAWLRLSCGRFIALERTSDHWHALSDARAYARRHAIPVTVLRKPLAVKLDTPPTPGRGWISIWPDPEDGGSWRVDHVSEHGDSAGILASAFSFEEAVVIAREAASRTGAVFEDPSHLGGAA